MWRFHGPSVAVSLLLLALVAGCVGGGFTDEMLSNSADSELSFERAAAGTGIDYTTAGDANGNGDGGVYVADVDRDGWEDVLAIGGERPVIFENDRGNFSRSGRLPDRTYPVLKGALFVDGDVDGDPDLLLVPRSGEPLFLANRDGQFVERDVGFDVNLDWGAGATAGDFNGDGCPDVYISQNGNWSATFPTGNDSVGRGENGNPNVLFRGDCSEFTRASANVSGQYWSTAASFADVTGDGRTDIHVANDYDYDRLYVNTGDGFVTKRLPHTNRHGMASEVADLMGDNDPDIFVTNVEFDDPNRVWEMESGAPMRNAGNNLLVRTENGTFVDRASALGVRQGGWGWAAEAADLDNDGETDLLHATKYYLQSGADGFYEDVPTRPAVWERNESGFVRRNASALGFQPSNGRGLVTLDADRDGRLDVLVADTTGTFDLYRNVGSTNHWIQVVPRQVNRTELGTTVTVVAGGTNHTERVTARADFFSQSSRTAHVGLGTATRIDAIHVEWPDGSTTTLTDIEADQRIVVGPEASDNGTDSAV